MGLHTRRTASSQITDTRHVHARHLGAAIAMVLLVVSIFATSGAAQADDSDTGLASGQAYVRVGNFVPGMGTTSIVLKPLGGGATTALAQGPTYGSVSPYEKVAPGSYTATVQETSGGPGAAPLLSRSFEVTADQARTVAIVGTSDQPRLALLTDDLTPPKAGTARIRLFSATASGGDVTVQAVGGPSIAGQTVLGQATDYTTVPAGAWTLQLSSDKATTSLQAVPVTGGSIYTVVVLDDNSPDGVRLQIVTDAAGAVMMPQGGAATGGGGTAPGHLSTAVATTPGSASGAGLLVALAIATASGAALVRSRRRTAGGR